MNSFGYDFREGDIISYSAVGLPYVDYKVESVKVQINRVDASNSGNAGSPQVWGAATIFLTVSLVP